MGYVSVTLLNHFSYGFTIMCYENLDLKLLFFHLLLYGVAVFVFKGRYFPFGKIRLQLGVYFVNVCRVVPSYFVNSVVLLMNQFNLAPIVWSFADLVFGS